MRAMASNNFSMGTESTTNTYTAAETIHDFPRLEEINRPRRYLVIGEEEDGKILYLISAPQLIAPFHE